MPIYTQHAGYEEEHKKITKVRDFHAGDGAVKSKGETYLPKLGGQDKDEYNAYKTRGYLIPAIAPTSKAIRGAIMRKPPVFEPSGAEYLLSDFTGTGVNIEEFTGDMVSELLIAGGSGYLVEYDEALNGPVAKQYARENIINFSDDWVILSQLYMEVDPKDKYKLEAKVEYLELTYDESGNYIQNIWRESDKKWVIVDTIYPDNRGTPLTSIPFVFSSVGEVGTNHTDPILLHMANVNHAQYMMSTDQRHGLHRVALPTMFLFGDLRDEDGLKKQIRIGAGSSNHIEDSEARVQLLEFTGQGLAAIKSAVDDDIATMASIGATMLTSDSGGVKAAETARIEASSETATLAVIANSVDATMISLLTIMSEWGGFSLPEFKVNRDFIDTKIDPQTLAAYLQTMMSGGMSKLSFLALLEKGELLPPGITADDELDRIESGADFEIDLDASDA